MRPLKCFTRLIASVRWVRDGAARFAAEIRNDTHTALDLPPKKQWIPLTGS